MVPKMRDVRSKQDLPEWMHQLKGFDLLEEHSDGASDSETWQFSLTLPNDLSQLAEHVDPLLVLAILVAGIGQIEDKVGEVVGYCRGAGRTWTQIGDALGISKQAAWERFSGDD